MSKFIKLSIAFMVGVAIAFLFSGALFSQDAVTITNMAGSPKIMKSGQTEWTACALKMTVGTGDQIQTGVGEYVELSFLKGKLNVTRIEPNSDVVVKLGAAPYTIELMKGSMMALLESLPKGSDFLVKTPIAIAGVRGSGLGVTLVTAGDKTSAMKISAFEHNISITNNNNDTPIRTVTQGNNLVVTLTDTQQPTTPITESEAKRWNDWVPPQHQLSVGATGGIDSTRNQLDAASDLAGKSADMLEERREASEEAGDVNRIAERQIDRSQSTYNPPTENEYK